MFEPLPAKFNFPENESKVLDFWERENVFEKSLELRKDAPRFVFYEGPPTANGVPHPGHCLTRAIKDLFPRYQTMCGKLVERKAGWDTHGLPVEIEVCKQLGISSKEEIEAHGLDKFAQLCIKSVFSYVREWEEMTRRLGFWVNLEEAYITYHQSYVESVWWGLKTLFERGLLYQGHKIVWWWAQGGTALSAGEVGEGYRTVEDPAVYIRFPLVRQADSRQPSAVSNQPGEGEAPAEPPHTKLPDDANVSLLVWTTTPWTLVSNHFAAVGPDIDYALVRDQDTDEYLYVAEGLVDATADAAKHKFDKVAKCKGADLVGQRYVPPFECYYRMDATSFGILPSLILASRASTSATDDTLGQLAAQVRQGGWEHIGWRVLAADFVTLESGTGLVHEAPAFGEVDFDLMQEERGRFVDFDAIPLINAVAPNGTFTDEAPEQYRGRWVKDCDKEIMRELKERGVLYHRETIKHEYPFCPRSENDPLIQYARRSWFVRTSQFRDEFLNNNGGIKWLPDHIQEGRFGDFLRNNVDWALSRERYWGTPLPIWVCEQTGKMEAIGSYAELLTKPGVQGTEAWEEAKKANPDLPDHLRVHKPYIDAITYDSPFAKEATERRSDGATKREGEAPAELRPRMRRVTEVIDCWWDAGSMPFAQWGFPHAENSVQAFSERFPANFISEAIDQTRGWFYGLLAISTLLFGKQGAVPKWYEERGRRLAEIAGDYSDMSKVKERLAANSAELQQLMANPPIPVERSADGSCASPAHVSAQMQSLHKIAGKRGSGAAYPHPYGACIVLGHVMGEDGLKMSKRTKNYREPSYVFDHYGADAMRWYFFSAQTPWTSVRFQEANIRDSQREFLLRLYNVFSFFNIYANIDGFEPGSHEATKARSHEAEEPPTSGGTGPTGFRPAPERGELDRWIVSELHRTIRFVREKLDAFENYPAAGRLNEFVDALSNWYVRRSRPRFWQPLQPSTQLVRKQLAETTGLGKGRRLTGSPHQADQDKWDAYNTLYEVLVALSKLIAPFTPFLAETMYQNLVGAKGPRGQGAKGSRGQGSETEDSGQALGPSDPRTLGPSPVSVHLCDYPTADETLIDEALAQEMDLVRQIVSLGRAARTASKLKVRQPLALVEIILARHEHADWLEAHSDLIAEELNIKQVEFATEADQYVTYEVKANFARLGPKFGKLAPKVGQALANIDAAEARKTLATTGELWVDVEGRRTQLADHDVQVLLAAKPGWSASQGRAGVVVVKTELTPELKAEGLTRELIHHVQGMRKKQDLPYQARITLFIQGPDEIASVVRQFAETVRQECLAERIEYAAPDAGDMQEVKVEGHAVQLAIAVQ